jgi:hypothetical protein
MNTLIKLGVAGSLALGSLAAQASIVVPSSSTPGDLVLFADIFNGSTLVATYAGDTGVSVTSVINGTLASGTKFSDANLTSFLAQATTGTTVDWMVGGAGALNAGSPTYGVTSTGGTFNATITSQNGSSLTTWSGTLASQLNTINGLINGSGKSLLGKDDSSFGIGFLPFQTSTDLSNWGGGTGEVATAGLTTSGPGSLIYALTAANPLGAPASVVQSYDASFTSSGLTFSAASTAPVPVPAAVWLLGSGLLGLAGVARRKTTAA